jgi:steroid delta-isomerase-like uncharacterized protein
MAQKNVQIVMDGNKAFNGRDYEAAVRSFAPDCVYVDVPRNIRLTGPVEIAKFLKEWAAGFSDAKIAEPKYIEGESAVVTTFMGRGKNDGRFGTLPPTWKQLSFPFCEVSEFGKDGKIVSVKLYYDRLTMLEQLGLAPKAEVGAGAPLHS